MSGNNAATQIDIEGQFWVPHDRHRSYGRLTFDRSTGTQLHLVYTNLTQWGPNGPHGPEPVDVLFGESLGGVPLTLMGVYPSKWRLEGLSGDVIDAQVELVLNGAHLRNVDDAQARYANATFHGLREFLVGAAVEGGVLNPRRDERFAADTLAVELDGAHLSLFAHRQPSFSRHEDHTTLAVSAGWSFDAETELTAVEQDYVDVLKDLVLFATRRGSHVTSLSVFRDQEHRQKLDVLRRTAPRDPDDREIYALALNLAEHDSPADLVARWYRLRAAVGPVWKVFFAALERRESLLEDRLLGLLAFAEGYHRVLHDKTPLTKSQQRAAEKAIKEALVDKGVRAIYRQALAHANSQTQGDRLRVLIDRALDVIGEEWWYVEREVLVKRLIHTRNWLVHWGDKPTHSVEDGPGLYELVRSLILVLYANILLDLGLTPDAAAKVIGSGWRLEGPPLAVFEVSAEE